MATKKVDRTPEKNLIGTGENAVAVEHRVVACNEQYITVDAGKLSKGLKTTFEGVAMVFDSIGVPVDIGVSVGAEDSGDVGSSVGTGSSVEKKKEKTEAEPVVEAKAQAETAPVEETQKEVPEEPDPAAEAKVAGTENTEDAENKEAKEAPVEKAAEVTPSITIDDITKIIVQKIKQNRKNNEKIGSILKAYQVSKVSDLSTSKYEAFLTDLSAI